MLPERLSSEMARVRADLHAPVGKRNSRARTFWALAPSCARRSLLVALKTANMPSCVPSVPGPPRRDGEQ